MNKYIVKIKAFKYGKSNGIFLFEDYEIIKANNKEIAKSIAKSFIISTKWALDLTVYPDLRTIKRV